MAAFSRIDINTSRGRQADAPSGTKRAPADLAHRDFYNELAIHIKRHFRIIERYPKEARLPDLLKWAIILIGEDHTSEVDRIRFGDLIDCLKQNGDFGKNYALFTEDEPSATAQLEYVDPIIAEQAESWNILKKDKYDIPFIHDLTLACQITQGILQLEDRSSSTAFLDDYRELANSFNEIDKIFGTKHSTLSTFLDAPFEPEDSQMHSPTLMVPLYESAIPIVHHILKNSRNHLSKTTSLADQHFFKKIFESLTNQPRKQIIALSGYSHCAPDGYVASKLKKHDLSYVILRGKHSHYMSSHPNHDFTEMSILEKITCVKEFTKLSENNTLLYNDHILIDVLEEGLRGYKLKLTAQRSIR